MLNYSRQWFWSSKDKLWSVEVFGAVDAGGIHVDRHIGSCLQCTRLRAAVGFVKEGGSDKRTARGNRAYTVKIAPSLNTLKIASLASCQPVQQCCRNPAANEMPCRPRCP